MSTVRRHWIIRGRVQGVWFRASAAEEAQSRSLRGWVRNRPDGGVETVVEGPAAEVEAFERWCREGPRLARVEDLESVDPPGDPGQGPFRVI